MSHSRRLDEEASLQLPVCMIMTMRRRMMIISIIIIVITIMMMMMMMMMLILFVWRFFMSDMLNCAAQYKCKKTNI